MHARELKRPEWLRKHMDVAYFLNNVIEPWKPKHEVWFFRWNGEASAMMGSFSALYIMYNLRRDLKLRPFARLTCYVPAAGVCCFMGEIFLQLLILPKVLNGRPCSICTCAQAAALQVSMGLVYPLVISPIIGFHLADRLLTYPIPSLSRAPREVLKLWWKLLAKHRKPLVTSFVLQGAVMMYITYRQQMFMESYLSQPQDNIGKPIYRAQERKFPF